MAPRFVLLAAGLALAFVSVAVPAGAQPLPTQLPLSSPAPDSFLVVLETTKGHVVIKAHRSWSPLGVDRLYHLAASGFYNGAVIYRVGPTVSYPGGFVVQFGLSNDSVVNLAWIAAGIADEPLREHHRRGRVMFAREGPHTRSIELAIDLSPNTGLDTVRYKKVVGFPPIGEVVEGMAVLDSLNRRYGNAPLQHEDSIAVAGRRYLDRAFPGLDRVERVSVVREWPEDDLEEATIRYHTHGGPAAPYEDIEIEKRGLRYGLHWKTGDYLHREPTRETRKRITKGDFMRVWRSVEENNIRSSRTKDKDLPPPDGNVYQLKLEWKGSRGSSGSTEISCREATDSYKAIEPVVALLKRLSRRTSRRPSGGY
jgi:cyclophilin family peptidyl-prolyl cis-trans isomerase